jgi:RNA methyltransferase, TrmH family
MTDRPSDSARPRPERPYRPRPDSAGPRTRPGQGPVDRRNDARGPDGPSRHPDFRGPRDLPRTDRRAAPQDDRRDDRRPAPWTGRRDDRVAPEAREEFHAICGLRACLAVFEARRADIVRVFYSRDRVRQLQKVINWAVARDIVHRQADDETLARVAQSLHHEGVAMTVRPRFLQRFNPQVADPKDTWVALDGVENPHNIGAIVRSCAFFGIPHMVIGGSEPMTRVSGAMGRMAEGGTEAVGLFASKDLARDLGVLRNRGVAVVGVETGGNKVLGVDPLPRPCVLVFGREQGGISAECRRHCSALYTIRGAGGMGSLNVSVTAGIALAELSR